MPPCGTLSVYLKPALVVRVMADSSGLRGTEKHAACRAVAMVPKPVPYCQKNPYRLPESHRRLATVGPVPAGRLIDHYRWPRARRAFALPVPVTPRPPPVGLRGLGVRRAGGAVALPEAPVRRAAARSSFFVVVLRVGRAFLPVGVAVVA